MNGVSVFYPLYVTFSVPMAMLGVYVFLHFTTPSSRGYGGPAPTGLGYLFLFLGCIGIFAGWLGFFTTFYSCILLLHTNTWIAVGIGILGSSISVFLALNKTLK